MRRRTALFVVCTLAIAGGCKRSSKPPPPSPDVSGLSAVPSSAEVIIGVDMPKLIAAPLVARAAGQLLLRDPKLAAEWAHIHDTCKLDVEKHVKHLVLVIGPSTAPVAPGSTAPNPGPTLLIATGVDNAISEAQLAECVRGFVGKGGGSLTAKPLNGRTLYTIKESARTVYMAFGRADTVVLGTNEAYVTEALGTGPKASDNPELAAWLKLADQRAPVWAVGRVGARIRTGLQKVVTGLKAGPSAYVVKLDPSSGVALTVDVLMASAEDAKQAESLAKSQLVGVSMWAQAHALGEVVQKIQIAATGTTLRMVAPLSMDDVNHVLSVLDEKGSPAQDSPPVTPAPPAAP